MPVNVVPGVLESSQEVQGLQGVLRNNVLPDIVQVSGITGREEVLVNSRLNETGQTNPAPVWYGWVTRSTGSSPPSLIGSTHLSPVYGDCLNLPNQIQGRNYPSDQGREKRPDPRPNPRDPNPQSHDVNLALNWRRYICVKAGGKKAGTLTVGFPSAPRNAAQVERALREWAKGSDPAHSALVQYLETTFNLGGGNHP